MRIVCVVCGAALNALLCTQLNASHILHLIIHMSEINKRIKARPHRWFILYYKLTNHSSRWMNNAIRKMHYYYFNEDCLWHK